MENLINFDFTYIFAGALVGLLVGLTGVGGGSLMTPLLTILFGVVPSVAVGTDLAFACITKGVGTLAHRIHNHVRWSIVKLLCLGSLPAAILTIIALKQLGEPTAEWQQFIKLSIGVSVLLTAISLIFRPKMRAWLEKHPNYQLKGRTCQIATVLSGVLIGVLVTVSSIGAGAIGASLIVFLYPTLKPAEVAGTDIAYAVPLTAIAALGHFWLGTVNFLLLFSLLIGSVPSIWVGAKLTKSLPEKVSRSILAGVLTLVGFKLVL
jgi:uncharacterized membrane protein YfcA